MQTVISQNCVNHKSCMHAMSISMSRLGGQGEFPLDKRAFQPTSPSSQG